MVQTLPRKCSAAILASSLLIDMNKDKFTRELKATAKELAPLAQATGDGTLTWNGTQYVKNSGIKNPNPYALAWQTTLVAIAKLIEAQETPLNEKQTKYLDGLLFGGMGSLNDLSFDPRSEGATAQTVNDRLDKQRRVLFASFTHE